MRKIFSSVVMTNLRKIHEQTIVKRLEKERHVSQLTRDLKEHQRLSMDIPRIITENLGLTNERIQKTHERIVSNAVSPQVDSCTVESIPPGMQYSDSSECVSVENQPGEPISTTRDLVRLRLLRENEELRQLQNKLENVKTQRARLQQIAESHARLEANKKLEAELDRLILLKDNQDLQSELDRAAQLARAREEAKHIQKEQMIAREHREKEEQDLLIQERIEMLQKIQHDECIIAGAEAERDKRTRAMRSELMAFMDQRRIDLSNRQSAEEQENEKNREYMQLLVEREMEQQRIRKEQESEKQKLWGKIADQVSRKNAAKVDMESLVNDLYFEQSDMRARHRALAEAASRRDNQLELLEQYKHQQEEKVRSRAKEKFEEDIVRKQLITEFHKRSEEDNLSKQKNREKMSAFHRELDSIIVEKRRMFDFAKAQEVEECIRSAESFKLQNLIIEEEKERILAEYATVFNQIT